MIIVTAKICHLCCDHHLVWGRLLLTDEEIVKEDTATASCQIALEWLRNSQWGVSHISY